MELWKEWCLFESDKNPISFKVKVCQSDTTFSELANWRKALVRSRKIMITILISAHTYIHTQ